MRSSHSGLGGPVVLFHDCHNHKIAFYMKPSPPCPALPALPISVEILRSFHDENFVVVFNSRSRLSFELFRDCPHSHNFP